MVSVSTQVARGSYYLKPSGVCVPHQYQYLTFTERIRLDWTPLPPIISLAANRAGQWINNTDRALAVTSAGCAMYQKAGKGSLRRLKSSSCSDHKLMNHRTVSTWRKRHLSLMSSKQLYGEATALRMAVRSPTLKMWTSVIPPWSWENKDVETQAPRCCKI